MPQGFVTTARGEVLNMDALKDAANLPLVKAKQTKTTVPKRTYPRPPINIRGNMPAQGDHKPELEEIETKTRRIDPETIPQVSAVNDTGVVETSADITGVKVKPTAGAIERAKERSRGGDVPPPEEVANEALGDILGDLKAANPNAEKAAKADEAPKTTRSRSRKST